MAKMSPEQRRTLASQAALDEQWASIRDWIDRLPAEQRAGFEAYLTHLVDHPPCACASCVSMYTLARVAWLEAKFRREGHV